MAEERMTLAALRVRAGYSQKEAAEKLEISSATLCRWEEDSSQVKYYQLQKIADLYQYPVDGIYFGKAEIISEQIKSTET